MTDLNAIIVSRIVEDLPAGLLVIDPEGVIVTVSPATSRLLGIPLSRIKGSGWGELFFGREENDQFNQLFLDLIQKEAPSIQRDVCYTTELGDTLRLNVRSSFIRHEGQLVAMVVLLTDITDLFRAQEAERRLMRERSDQQNEKIESLGRLAQSIAHQVRNPASAIGGFAKRMEGVLSSHGVACEYPAIIIEQARRLETVVSGVVRLGALRKTCVTGLDASRVLGAAVARAEDRAASLGKRMTATVRILKTDIDADEALLNHALDEVLANCIDFSDEKEVLTDILLESRDGGARLSISDQGPGIEADSLPYVFDPFFTTKALGTGLGLTVARQAALELGGSIEARRGPMGNGTAIEIVLPATANANGPFPAEGADGR